MASRGPRWFVYIARCRDGSLYTGVTNDLARRIEAHNAGRGAAYTRSRRPIELVYSERADGLGAALRREWAIKQLPRAAKLEMVKRAPGFGLQAPGRAGKRRAVA